MRLTKNQLREYKVFNPYNLASVTKSKLYIDYSPQDIGQGGRSSHWSVVGIDFHTDPDAHWQDNGNKSFLVWGRTDKDSKLQEAMDWVKEIHGITEWERDPFGGYQIKGTLKKLLEVKDADNS